MWPQVIDCRRQRAPKQLARGRGFGAVVGENAVEQGDSRGHLDDLGALRVVGTFRGSDEQTEDQCRHRADQCGAELDGIFRLGVQVMLGKHVAQHHAEHAADEEAGEYNRPDFIRTHR